MKRVLALLCVIACLAAMLCIPALAADTITVHARIPMEWDNPSCWAWKTPDNTNAFDTWPGKAMNMEGEWYTIEVPSWVNAVIINGNGGTVQTGDLAVEAGRDLWITVNSDNSAVVAYNEEGTDLGSGNAGSSDSQPAELTNAYVAGVGALCGSEWNCNDEANKMTEVSDGVFEKTFSNVAAGTYELKVTDGTWDNSWGGDGPDGNYVLVVDLAGDVTITFDASTSTISVSGAGNAGSADDIQPSEPEVVEITSAYVAGVGALCGSEWDCADANNLMTEVSDGVFEITYKNVAAGTYELKVTDGTWDHSWGTDGGNYVLTVDAASDVTISFDAATTTITVKTAAPAEPAPTEPAETEPAETEPTETEPAPTQPAKVDDTKDTAKARRTALIATMIGLFAVAGVAVVMSLVPSKNKG